jgi:hypothetical protein
MTSQNSSSPPSFPLYGPHDANCCQSQRGLRHASAATRAATRTFFLVLNPAHPSHRLVSRVHGSLLQTRARLRADARKDPNTPASTGASLKIYRDSPPAGPGKPTSKTDGRAGALDAVVIDRSRSKALNLRCPIDNPPSHSSAEYTHIHRSAT